MAAIAVEQAFQLALAWEQAGHLGAAERMYRQVVHACRDHAGARHRLGMIASANGHFQEASEWLAKAVAQSPTHATYHADLGIAYRYLDRLDDAIAAYQQAVALDPDFAEAHSNLAEAFVRSGRFPEAVESCQRALRLQPDYADAHNNLGLASVRLGRLDEALASFRRALDARPDFADVHKNLVTVFAKMGRWGEAVASGERAVALQPHDAESQSNLGVAFRGRGDFDRALRGFRNAVGLREAFVDAHWNLACLLLLLGEYEEGWREFEWRRRFSTTHPRDFSQPRWTGQPTPDQTILVHAEQGLGDTIQFLRYLPLVRERSGAAHLILECQPELRRLLEQNTPPAARITVTARPGSDAASPAFDWQIPLLSLPLAVNQSAPSGMTQPYLRADSKLRTAWRKRLGAAKTLRTGLAWAGNKSHESDGQRSIEPERLLPLLRVPGIRFYSLQLDAHGRLPAGLADAGLLDHTGDIADFADTAALMANLDLIITVDTAAAHLAGALGRPVWTLLPSIPDWRWGLERDDTPWYPTMRLFRQKTAGDWDEVLQRVADELSVFIANSAGRSA